MENKKSVSGGIHRDGYSWKDSLIVSVLIFFMMFFVGTGLGLGPRTAGPGTIARQPPATGLGGMAPRRGMTGPCRPRAAAVR